MSVMIEFGCYSDTCMASNPSPIHLGPAGSQVTMCAVNASVTVKFTGDSPFVSKKKFFTIPKGTCTNLEEVAKESVGKEFGFRPTCLDENGDEACPTPKIHFPPEMIVP
jgi:hypothetical protein